MSYEFTSFSNELTIDAAGYDDSIFFCLKIVGRNMIVCVTIIEVNNGEITNDNLNTRCGLFYVFLLIDSVEFLA
jgi:hypothetical protein